MGCFIAKPSIIRSQKYKMQQEDTQKDFAQSIRFCVVPPSECGSQISNLTTKLQKSPQKLFKKTDVWNCFVYVTDALMPQHLACTQKDFQIFQILNQNFSNNHIQSSQLKKTSIPT